MSRHIADLAGLEPAIETISPEEAARREAKAMRGIVREQGQVMSAALENNHSLYHTNKKLRRENEQLKTEVTTLATRCAQLNTELVKLSTPINCTLHELQERNQFLESANKELRTELIKQLHPELESEQRKQALERVKKQQEELKATGLVPTEEEINGPLPGETIVEHALMGGTDGEA